jgi:asparagine synthase (glutamine-hydrolysing)
MCGIALVLGPGDSSGVFGEMLAALAPRGERLEVAERPGLLAGTQRLAIVDRDRAVQPRAHGRYLLCYNGELFNYPDLGSELGVEGGLGDTAVLAAAFARWGEQAVRRLRGEYAFVVADPAASRVYLARDPLGVKPLYWARRDGRLHVASEIKALVPLGVPVHEVPPGQHGWATAEGGPELAPHVDLGALDTEPVEDPAEAAKLVRAAFEDSVRVRVDTDLPVGVIVSGGLDSSLTLLHVREMHPDCVAFTVGAPGSEDLHYARRLCADLSVPHEVIELSPGQIGLAAIREAIAVSELTEYGDIINAVVSVPLFRRVRQAGVKVVLTGDGSDELFGGYAMYDRAGGAGGAGRAGDQARRLFLHKLATLGRTELQRVDRTSMAATVEARVPFLDLSLVELALRLPMSLKVRDGQEKWILREAFAGQLPDYIRRRPKNPMSHSSGLHERARLYKPLFARIHRSLGYDRCAPVRRDFSTVLEACGNDLDQAVARAEGDYTARERARDLAGALRWNAAQAAGRGAGRSRGSRRSGRSGRSAGSGRTV